MAKKEKKKYTSIGGQALMEGIMMRGPKLTTMAVRRADGSIYTETTENAPPSVWNKIPFVRGIVSFVQSMTNGSKVLMRSADIAIEDEERMEKERKAAELAEKEENTKASGFYVEVSEEETADAAQDAEITETADTEENIEAADNTAEVTASEAAAEAEDDEPAADAVSEAESCENETEERSVPDAPKTTPEEWLNPHAEKNASSAKSKKDKEKKKDSDMEGWTFLSVILGICLAVLLFVFLPTWCYTWILKIPGAEAVIGGKVWKSVIEGVIRIVIFVLYILLCTTMKEIRRVFEYHGAEHKTIFCYEAGEELTVENVRKYKRFHPRCGTSFIVLTVLVGIISGICISVFFPQLDNTWLRPVIKLAMLPLVMGVGYELLKLCGRFDNIFTRIIRAPGMWVQRITTREPDDGQIECAIAALKPVIPENGEDMA